MNRYACAGILLLALPTVAAAAEAPEFLPLATRAQGKSLLTADGEVARPQAHVLRAPTVSEMRVVPDAGGKLKVQCTEVPNPRLRQMDDEAVRHGERR